MDESDDAQDVVTSSPNSLPVKKNTLRSKRQVGIAELRRVIDASRPPQSAAWGQDEARSDTIGVSAHTGHSKPALFLAAGKEELAETPRMPWELNATQAQSAAKPVIMNISTEAKELSKEKQPLTRAHQQTTIRYPGDIRRKVALRDLDMKSWSLSVNPTKQFKRRKVKPTDEETPILPASHQLKVERTGTDSVPGLTPTNRHRAISPIIIDGAQTGVITLTPKIGRLIQVKEYIITDPQQVAMLPYLYSPDVVKAFRPYDGITARRNSSKYRAAHINYDSALQERGFSPFKCTKAAPLRDRSHPVFPTSSLTRGAQSKVSTLANSRESGMHLQSFDTERSESPGLSPHRHFRVL